jgi:hypothetical protein
MADSARLVTGVSPGRSWNFASRSGPLMTAVVRWSMPQLCPKITSLPAQSPYILFKRSRAASCGSENSEPSSGPCFVANCQQPAQQPRPAARGSRWPPGCSGNGRSAVPGCRGGRSPGRSPTAHKPRRGAVRSSPHKLRCILPFPYQWNKLSKPVLGQSTAVGGGRFSWNQVPPESEPGLDPGSTTPQRWKHDGVHSLADALSPVLIQAVRDIPRR